ncbi:MAG: CoA activase [Polyangiaceae bacterium]|nr:CoA activase [Polyangiaceae bacterium]
MTDEAGQEGGTRHPARADTLVIGVDVGSTTVKAVVLDPSSGEVLWSDYQRHHTKQPEKVLELLERILEAFPGLRPADCRVFVTGSGAAPLVEPLGAKFVQEVNAVCLAVEHRHPDVRSVVELGGQDAKIIVFREDKRTGRRTPSASMNDKCASGTGATIDKCMLKVGAEAGFAATLRFDPGKLHHVAAKCGVFAETDIVNLTKAGIPKGEVLCSLADAIVMQNLSVLTRGSTLRPRVCLLGGPNTYLPFLRDCWQRRIPETWEQRGIEWPRDVPIDELVFVPESGQLYAALGAALHAAGEAPSVGRFRGLDPLREFVHHGRRARLGELAGPPLSASAEETRAFVEAYRVPRFEPPRFTAGQVVRATIGLDGGSTSSKAVLVGESGEILGKAYRLSQGNPIEDTKVLLRELRDQVEGPGASLEVLGFGATGYAADILEQCVLADANVVETVAHVTSAVAYFGDIDVVCDIGGQDIKVLFLHDREVTGFKLSTSCSAGNGMLLQAMADQFGVPIDRYAEHAFAAELSPKFSYGCAVFLDTDRVNFQKEGFQREELLAGLAQVLPKNVWQYVAQIPRLASLGRRFVLQGGTQYNLAAVKAQVDYVKSRVPGAEVLVHPHAGEAGAIGAGMEALRRWRRGHATRFIGVEATLGLEHWSRNDESTVCHFCANECKRTFIDARRPDGSTARYIAGFSCEKGTVESKEAMHRVVQEKKTLAARYPNLVEYEARRAFQHHYAPAALPEAGTPVADLRVERGLFRLRRRAVTRPFARSSEAAAARRRALRIGIPRVLNLYSVAPFFRAYFEALGVLKGNVVFSDPTTEELFTEGARYGSVDPCFPAKVVQAHVHQLLFHAHSPERPLSFLFFPMLTHVPNFVEDTVDDASCPIVAGTPAVIRAAFTKEQDFFAQRGIDYVTPALPMTEPLLTARRLFEAFGERLGVTEDESDHACREGWRALEAFEQDLQDRGRAVLEEVEREGRLAVLVLGRPYHSDPGIGHAIHEDLQALGYPVLSVRSLPRHPELLARVFERELAEGTVRSPLELSHLWPENYSANSAQKVWAAAYAARHPNLAVLDLSSFKCGHDAPTYGLIDSILRTSRTPTAALHDLDANKPGGSIQIRIKTYAHSLRLAEERLADSRERERELAAALERRRRELEHARARLEGGEAVERWIDGMNDYRPSGPPAPEPAARAVVQLGRKAPGGGIVRLAPASATEAS